MAQGISIISKDEENTQAVARTIAPLFRSGDLIVLDGDLGAGKTYFVKGFAAGFQSQDPVNSPTFSIANFYRTTLSDILHIDLYRIATMDEFNDLGLVDYFNQSIVLIEWGKKFADYLDDHLLVSFIIENDNTRLITFEGIGERYGLLMDELKTTLKGGLLC